MNKIAAAASEASNFVRAWQLRRYAASLHPPHFSRSLSSEPLLESGLDEAQECEGSITVSYLVNSCGFSAEKALTLSKKVSFETTERPDSVLGLLRDHGFADSEISKLVSKVPRLLLADPEKILSPKLEFLRSLGLSGTSIALAICRNPIFLTASLKNALVPGFNLFKKELLSDEKVVNLITRSWGVLSDRVQSNIAQNLSVLRALEVPQPSISVLLSCHPGVVCQKPDDFNKDVEKVVGMGFTPKTLTFVNGLQVIATITKSTWVHKLEVYKSCGWTEEEILLAFRKKPTCMYLSEKNIRSKMDFLVNKMGWQPAYLARYPDFLSLSLERRIIPRCSVIRVLLVKGLLKKKYSISSLLITIDSCFISKFVTRYQESVPQLLDIFRGKLSLQELGFQFEGK
ncbi:transcription termination factor MTERF9, chloroplastic-like [Pyrus x bretschneideri]|uniref:transcription termination factor MTERF9, chloroplastic-like n=1 Tax=Pyrus x bretschneideri TaxID=225117 RepID=UPI002030257E|nr:transcription termination factor MTERF9, chloroplastic-like [Pyrus x bretschneideri]